MAKGPKPACPRPGHEDSHVVFDGHYGKPGHRRQRFRCYPNGDRSKFHRFTEPLPREAAPSGECEVCERHLEPHEGRQTPREYLFTAREIAATLMELGRGETYQSASWRVRKRFNRWPVSEDGQRRMTSHGQLAADWVEAFAPIVFEPHEISLWPDDWVVLDNLPFRRRAWDAEGKPIPNGVALFEILMAYGKVGGHGRILRLEAVPSPDGAAWARFLRAYPGHPRVVVSDMGPGIGPGVRKAWPSSERWISEWHLKNKLRQHLTKAGLNSDSERIWRRLDFAFNSVYQWESFRICAWRQRKRCPKAWKWIEDNEPLILDQFSRRPGRDDRNWFPLSSGALEARGERIKAAIAPRRNGFRNRERLNRLLTLIQLEVNADASERDYARLIRDQLRAQHGVAPPRRVIADPGHHSTLLAQPSPAQQARAHRGRSSGPRRRRRPKSGDR